MIDTKNANSAFLSELEDAAVKVIRHGKYILGPEVDLFEKEVASYLGVKHAIGMSSGTDALLAALMAFEIGCGDEVICPSFTFFATAGAIARTGAIPVFVDISNKCFTINTDAIRKAITKKTKAIMPVHLFGQCADMIEIMNIAKEYNLVVIEDACQAIGAVIDGAMAGTTGDVGCYSFFPTKNLGGLGDSGLVVTNQDSIAEKLKAARNHGSKTRYYHDFIGGNFRMDTMQAAMLSVKLKHLPSQNITRAEHAKIYNDIFLDMKMDESVVSWPRQVRGVHTYNQYTLRIHKNRDKLIQNMSDLKIGSAIYYPLPLHEQICFTNKNSVCHTMNETDLAAKEVLSIPISYEITNSDIEAVASAIVACSKIL